MRKIMLISLVFTAELFVSLLVPAQGTLYVSNLGQTPTGSAAIGSDAWIAQQFYIYATDPSTYALNSIELLLNPASGSPNGFAVSIYNASLTDLGSLTSSTDPLAGGIFSYTASGITLLPGNNYYVVVRAATSLAQGAYSWSATQGTADNGNWVINDIYYSSSDGSNWTGHLRQNVFQMAIYATAIPEPATLALAALGLAALSFRRRKL